MMPIEEQLALRSQLLKVATEARLSGEDTREALIGAMALYCSSWAAGPAAVPFEELLSDTARATFDRALMLLGVFKRTSG